MQNISSRFLNILFVLLFYSVIGHSQNVTSVKYHLAFDDSTCWYDFSIIIDEGFAEGIGQRTQFNAQISFVVPTGSVVSIADKYLPLKDNQSYTGTEPMNWFFGPTISNPAASPGNDFFSVNPTLVPTSQYNNIYAGDTLKLFSLDIDSPLACGEGIRLFENGVDPDSNGEGMNGADYTQGFTLGGVTQIYMGNTPVVGPMPPEIISITDNSGVAIDLDASIEHAACAGAISYSWTGPDGFTSNLEDVFISPATSSNFGEYTLIVENAIGCSDTTTILVESQETTDEVTSVDLILNATFQHISAHLNISGDDNHNSSFLLEYRLTGTSQYLIGSESMRAFPEMIVDGAELNENFHAASAMFLQPNTNYDLRLTLSDADGGSEVLETTILTKKIPEPSQNGVTYYVIPGNGGGSGTMTDPYQGIQDAVNVASPGDIIEVGDGIYSPFSMLNAGTMNAPITVRSSNLHGAIIDGGDTVAGIITIGSFADSIQHIIIDGFEIRNGSWGIDAQNTQFLTVKNNKIYDVDFGFYNRRQNGWEHDQYLTNNEITGQTGWPQLNGEIPAERGIDIRGNRNVVSYNSISDFGDGISTDGVPYKVSYALDIHHNLINRIVDDLIEVDGVLSNVRVYRNKGYNGRMGVSLAPIFGGPAYVFNNEFYNLETSTFKMNRSPAGLYIVHNTSVKSGQGTTSPSGWQNTVFKNNVIVSAEYCIEEFGLVEGSQDDWDHNGYKSLRTGDTADPWFKWDNVQYSDISALKLSGALGANSLEVDLMDFEMVSVPSSYATEASLSGTDARLAINSALMDEGEELDNLQLGFVTDGMPDIGAYEYGSPVPDIGHDFTNVCEREDFTLRMWNGNINQAWYLPENWTPCGVPTEESNVIIPAGCPFYPFLNTDAVMRNLTILNGGVLHLQDESVEVQLKGN